jgi:oligoendopeptidase F
MLEQYVHLLSSGGSTPPVDILQSIGIDVMNPVFYENAFTLIASWVDEFEKLASPA